MKTWVSIAFLIFSATCCEAVHGQAPDVGNTNSDAIDLDIRTEHVTPTTGRSTWQVYSAKGDERQALHWRLLVRWDGLGAGKSIGDLPDPRAVTAGAIIFEFGAGKRDRHRITLDAAASGHARILRQLSSLLGNDFLFHAGGGPYPIGLITPRVRNIHNGAVDLRLWWHINTPEFLKSKSYQRFQNWFAGMDQLGRMAEADEEFRVAFLCEEFLVPENSETSTKTLVDGEGQASVPKLQTPWFVFVGSPNGKAFDNIYVTSPWLPTWQNVQMFEFCDAFIHPAFDSPSLALLNPKYNITKCPSGTVPFMVNSVDQNKNLFAIGAEGVVLRKGADFECVRFENGKRRAEKAPFTRAILTKGVRFPPDWITRTGTMASKFTEQQTRDLIALSVCSPTVWREWHKFVVSDNNRRLTTDVTEPLPADPELWAVPECIDNEDAEK